MRTRLAGRGLAVVTAGATTWADRTVVEAGWGPRAGFVARVAGGRRHDMRARLAFGHAAVVAGGAGAGRNTQMVEAGPCKGQGVMTGFTCLLGGDMRGRHDGSRDALAAAGMATRTLGGRPLENALDVTRFAPHVSVGATQLKACLRMIETSGTRPRGEGRQGSHSCHTEQQNVPYPPQSWQNA